MIYDDMTDLELLVEELLHIVHTDDGQKRMDMSGPFIRKLNQVFDKETNQAVIDERMRIAKELYARSEHQLAKKLLRPTMDMEWIILAGSHAEAAIQANRLVYSVYPWQEWFDMGPIHGGK